MNTEEIYFKKTPISEPPFLSGKYISIDSYGLIQESQYYHEYDEWQLMNITHWLQPCSPPDEGAFAEWCNVEEWDIIEYTETDEAIWMNGEAVKTTSQLLQLFRQKGGGGFGK